MSENPRLAKNNARNASSEAFDHLVYLRVFEGCNIFCEHCFIPHNPKRMTLNQIRQVPDIVSQFAEPGDRVLLQWHGGEPTVLGPDFMAEALAAIHESDVLFRWIHGIQTNLMTYDKRWRDIYRHYFDSGIGVSWDPEIRLMRRGVRESNRDYDERFWSQIERLIGDGTNPYLVVTGTRIFFERFKDPFEFFALMESRGVPSAHIERLTRTGYARQSWNRIGLNNAEYSRHMIRFARAYDIYCRQPRAGRQPFNLSPFDGLAASVDRLLRGESGGYGCLSGACDTRFHTIDANGYKVGCTALTSEYDNARAGEQVIRFQDFQFARHLRQESSGPSCFECEFKPICSSGCFALDKVDNSGECSGAYRLFDAIRHLNSRP